jgi:predicted HicB family RNase H-like nuclease
VAGHRGRAKEAARRTNAAAQLLAAGRSVVAATRQLARRHRLSERQARRYVERARQGGRVEVPKATVVFTVKVAGALARRARAQAKRRGQTLSAFVTHALLAFLERGDAEGRSGP